MNYVGRRFLNFGKFHPLQIISLRQYFLRRHKKLEYNYDFGLQEVD